MLSVYSTIGSIVELERDLPTARRERFEFQRERFVVLVELAEVSNLPVDVGWHQREQCRLLWEVEGLPVM